ncbi:acyltransferase [Aquimonas voraii]|uniref:1-acyl-sn-glycerol-3-phosphate acyltransferase n=1 Tax=Aquimonas voraii TaxID=265719 RepID=A0A1G6SGK4_9GAMM|nr:acyltransferase [Aquimonas voraii]SDD15774.1 1-acyl-sn-glycerol-3-phosphate acyltransferase [Aquimonas voraii]
MKPVLASLRAAFTFSLVALNTAIHVPVLLLFALFKLVLRFRAAQVGLTRLLIAIATSWVAVNSALMRLLTPTRYVFEGLDALQVEGWYLVIANHQSWVDIPVLQMALNRRIPMLKFFLKQQLMWVPVMGLAWWALDFPFMRRHTREQIARDPSLRGKDIESTRRACAKFRYTPVSVMNFVEGSRFTPGKHARQNSPYTYLLAPKAGGVAFVLQAMGDSLQALVDVSIAYPAGRPSLYDLLAGRIPEIRLRVRTRPLPRDLLGRDYQEDAEFRERFQSWLNGLWAEKDAELGRMLANPPAR